jgi:hypothetical protein
MSQRTIVLVCPECEHSCRTQREVRVGAKMRCPNCNAVSRFFIHGNGAVELRPVGDEPSAESCLPSTESCLPSTESRLPPRSAEQEATKASRTIFTSRRRNRPIGGYLAFEKSRSYLGMFAFWTVVGLGSLAAYVYFHFIDTTGRQMGKTGNNAINADIVAKRTEHLKKQQDALKKLEEREKLKNQLAKVPPPRAEVELGRLSGDQGRHRAVMSIRSGDP